MTSPNQHTVAPMPEAGDTSVSQGPNFESPQPTKSQKISMRFAGIALGLGRKASPEDTMKTLVTKVGGYKPNDFGGQQTTTYVKEPKKALYKPALRDETVNGHSANRYYKNASDFTEETSGLFLGHAAERVAKGESTREGHLKLREKAARSLVRRGTRGGHYKHIS